MLENFEPETLEKIIKWMKKKGILKYTLSNSADDGLSFGFFIVHFLKKSLNSADINASFLGGGKPLFKIK